MSPDQQNAILEENLKLSHFFRTNGAIRNGHPDVLPLTKVHPLPAAEPKPVAAAPTPAPAPEPAGLSKLAKSLIAIGALGATTAGAGTAYYLNQKDDAPPAVEQPQEPDAPATGNLLEHLRQEGYNRPPL